MPKNAPPSVARAGITAVEENIQPGQEIAGLEKDLVRIFRPEIEAFLLKRIADRQGKKPCPANSTSI